VIVLDTHAWIWWLSAPERLSAPAGDAISEAASVGVSTLSVWELAMLVRRERIQLDRDIRDWVGRALAEERVTAIPPSAEVALAAASLDSRRFPGDPADRFIYATAQANTAVLVTRDTRLREFDPAGTVW
jgi:PIN domain nuclease of toxin-antitoxin system